MFKNTESHEPCLQRIFENLARLPAGFVEGVCETPFVTKTHPQEQL